MPTSYRSKTRPWPTSCPSEPGEAGKGGTILILTLKKDEKMFIGDNISVTGVEIRGKQIRLGIEAPAGLLVLREKLAGKEKANRSNGWWIKAKSLVPRQGAGDLPPLVAPSFKLEWGSSQARDPGGA
jgi:carbon storage regulator